MKENEQIIRELAQAWDIPSDKITESRFSADTNTLYSSKNPSTIPSAKSSTEIREKYHEIVVEQKEFEDIIKDILHFLVIKDTGIYMYDEIRIRESHNLVPTGRINIRKITRIANTNSHPGIKEGYVVVGW